MLTRRRVINEWILAPSECKFLSLLLASQHQLKLPPASRPFGSSRTQGQGIYIFCCVNKEFQSSITIYKLKKKN